MQLFYISKQSLREAYLQTVISLKRKHEARSYGLWRRLFFNERMVRGQVLVRQMGVKSAVFKLFKSKYEAVIKQSTIRSKAVRMIKSKAFGGLITHLQQRKEREIERKGKQEKFRNKSKDKDKKLIFSLTIFCLCLLSGNYVRFI